MSEATSAEDSDAVAERAIALATPGGDEAVSELAGAGREGLQKAQVSLVQRISLRSDDYEATAALRLVNKALAELGWEDPYYWKNRRKP